MPAITSSPSGPYTHPAPADLHPASDQILSSTLSTSPYTFLQPPPSLYAASLVLAKRYLDSLATSTSEAQTQKLENARKKRKRGEVDGHDAQGVLRLKRVHTEGFGIEQIWKQARRVLDAGQLEVERSLPDRLPDGGALERSLEISNGHVPHRAAAKSVRFNEEGFSEARLSEVDEMDDEHDELDEQATTAKLDAEDKEAGMLDAEDIEEEEDLADDVDEDADAFSGKQSNTFIPDRNGLNDGFFSIDEFNRQSEFLEQQDVRGDPNAGAASDEEDIDWDAKPAALALPPQDQAINLESDDGDGPTFGNADLHAADISDDDASAVSALDDGIQGNTNSILYADFFLPPPRPASKRSARLPKTQPPPTSSLAREPSPEKDLQRTISSVRRDLFSDTSPHSSDEDGPLEEPHDRRSSHQKRTAALASEIRRLEAAAVAKRDWTLTGEARAADRPLNSLLESDLDFERVGKPVPVITSEVSEDIEALIKRRILARDFDEVTRRRPGNLVTGAKDVRRGRFELDDSKAQQSLAEIYEAEHLASTDPTGYTSKSDAKLKKDEEAISALWAEVSAKLDALSSWHYRPKPPSASINVVADVPTISMEDAQPTVGGEVGTSRLAPQEVYRAGEGVDRKREVVTKGGETVGREEMSREDRRRRRRREKERIRKRGEGVDGAEAMKSKVGGEGVGSWTRKGEEKEVLGQLKKGGVRVIGKKGEVRDVEGRAVEVRGAGKGGGGYKL